MSAQFITPAVTVFDEYGRVDEAGNRRVFEHLIHGGVDGIVTLGSAGEFFGMSMEEQKRLIRIAAEAVGGRVRLLAGAGRMDVRETVELANDALDHGADGALVVSPYYFRLDDGQIEAFYDKVALDTKGKVYLYNFPDRTGYDISPALALRLREKHENIAGCKDTVPLMGHTRQMIVTVKGAFPDFEVFSGYDEFFAHNLLCGGNGCISALSNVFPEITSGWARAMDAQDMALAAFCQRVVGRLMALYEVCSPFIPAIKCAMRLRGVDIREDCLFPLGRADGRQAEQIKAIVEDVADMWETRHEH